MLQSGFNLIGSHVYQLDLSFDAAGLAWQS